MAGLLVVTGYTAITFRLKPLRIAHRHDFRHTMIEGKMMEIKIGEKYKSIYDDSVVKVVSESDATGCYCAENEDGIYVLLESCELKPLRTTDEVERDKLCAVLKDMGVVADRGRISVADYILENYVRKDDPRVVEPVSWDDFIGTVDTFDWLIDNKHICEKKSK